MMSITAKTLILAFVKEILYLSLRTLGSPLGNWTLLYLTKIKCLTSPTNLTMSKAKNSFSDKYANVINRIIKYENSSRQKI